MRKDVTLADLVRRQRERQDEHARDIDIMETSYEVESARWKEEAADLAAALDLLREARRWVRKLNKDRLTLGEVEEVETLLTRLVEPADSAPTEGAEGGDDAG